MIHPVLSIFWLMFWFWLFWLFWFWNLFFFSCSVLRFWFWTFFVFCRIAGTKVVRIVPLARMTEVTRTSVKLAYVVELPRNMTKESWRFITQRRCVSRSLLLWLYRVIVNIHYCVSNHRFYLLLINSPNGITNRIWYFYLIVACYLTKQMGSTYVVCFDFVTP